MFSHRLEGDLCFTSLCWYPDGKRAGLIFYSSYREEGQQRASMPSFSHSIKYVKCHHSRDETYLDSKNNQQQVAVTCFFRNSTQFAYAARVAAFTAVVIFTGSNTVLGADGEAVSLARIVNTVVGSVIYLLVDMLLGGWPNVRLGALPLCTSTGFIRRH